jgi:hypothetical protein
MTIRLLLLILLAAVAAPPAASAAPPVLLSVSHENRHLTATFSMPGAAARRIEADRGDTPATRLI